MLTLQFLDVFLRFFFMPLCLCWCVFVLIRMAREKR